MRRRAFTLIELLMVVAVLAILAAILLPVFAVAREAARGVSCLARERQLGMAMTLYEEDYGCLPLYALQQDGAGPWWEVLAPYTKSARLFRCPSVDGQRSWGEDYAVNVHHVIQYGPGVPWVTPAITGPAHSSGFEHPASTLLLADGEANGQPWPALYCPIDGVPWGYGDLALTWGIADRHRGGSNCLFLDGHAQWHRRQELLRWPAPAAAEWFGHYPG